MLSGPRNVLALEAKIAVRRKQYKSHERRHHPKKLNNRDEVRSAASGQRLKWERRVVSLYAVWRNIVGKKQETDFTAVANRHWPLWRCRMILLVLSEDWIEGSSRNSESGFLSSRKRSNIVPRATAIGRPPPLARWRRCRLRQDKYRRRPSTSRSFAGRPMATGSPSPSSRKAISTSPCLKLGIDDETRSGHTR